MEKNICGCQNSMSNILVIRRTSVVFAYRVTFAIYSLSVSTNKILYLCSLFYPLRIHSKYGAPGTYQ